MMNNIKDVPKQEGFEFIGICKDGSEISCIVKKNILGQYRVYEILNDPITDELEGWKHKP